MDWSRDSEIWPNAKHSRFVACAPHRWHVQEAGSGRSVLLLHGAGGATQSWRSMFPILAGEAHVIAPDLPGQGFSKMGTRTRCGLEDMSDDLARLLKQEGWHPDIVVGHSAGGALALWLAESLGVPTVIGLNAALGKFEGVAGWLFPLIAKAMSLNPLVPPLLARMTGSETRVRELLAATGSRTDPLGVALYRKLMSDAGHIDGTLAMMARWDIDPLLARLPTINAKVMLVTGELDGTVLPEVSARAATRLPDASHVKLPELGHLMHEEAPEKICGLILDVLGETCRASHTAAAG